MNNTTRHQLTLFDPCPVVKPLPPFDGQTFDYDQDFERLEGAMRRVAHLMSDGRERTLAEIARACGCTESGASARLRDLRKEKFQAYFGKLNVDRRRLDGGLWAYKVTKGE